MNEAVPKIEHSLGLRAGDWVEVRSREEILATLDERGALDAVPFMPEMLQYCGRRFQVYRTAHKTCDTISEFRSRRMTNTVHLPGLRCDGSAHAGCQAACLIFWKEAWLKRVPGPHAAAQPSTAQVSVPTGRCTVESLTRATRAPGSEAGEGEFRYACQATELVRASAPLGSWEPGQFVQDLTSRNVGLRDFVRYMAIALYNELVRRTGRGRPYPHVRGLAEQASPGTPLNLRPGELVQVRSKEEIMRTLNAKGRNRGLWFDVEMLRHCGKTCRVLARVERLIDEKSGRLVTLSNDCIILENVFCSGFVSRDRLFCTRSIFPYWREAWLKRVP